eukprot:gene6451-6518_t
MDRAKAPGYLRHSRLHSKREIPMPSHENEALWLMHKRGRFAVGPAPMPEPAAGEIVVRTRAIAVNPFERLIQAVGDLITPWIVYPAIVGSDIAGDVVAVGCDVTRFRPGNRVVGFACGSEKGRRAAEGAFQTHVVLPAHMTAPIPPAMTYEAAAVLPLALTTAAAALFQDDMLALDAPSAGAVAKGRTVLVWGGSTSVGCNAIQLAVAAGYDVIATASPGNHAYLRQIGARAVFDRKDPAVLAQLKAELRGRETCGAIAIGAGSTRMCIDVLAGCPGRRFVAVATPPVSFDDVPAGRGRWRKLIPVLASIVLGNGRLAMRAWRKGVRTRFIWGGAPVNNAVGPMIFEQFLPAALAEGRYVSVPPARVFGEGLAAVPRALECQRQGVSATKLVVRLT